MVFVPHNNNYELCFKLVVSVILCHRQGGYKVVTRLFHHTTNQELTSSPQLCMAIAGHNSNMAAVMYLLT